jgi:putative transposase
MSVMEAKLLNGTAKQYHALDEAIRTAQFVRNIRVRYWMDNRSVNKAVLYAYCQDLAKEFDFVRKSDPAARQAGAERAWASISRFHTGCRKQRGQERLSAVQEELSVSRVQAVRLGAVS